MSSGMETSLKAELNLVAPTNGSQPGVFVVYAFQYRNACIQSLAKILDTNFCYHRPQYVNVSVCIELRILHTER